MDMPDTKSPLDLGPKSTLFMHTGVEKSSEYQDLLLPPTRLPLPWAWSMPCPKARVGLWPAESPICSIPVELCVGSRRLSDLFYGTPGMQAWRNEDQLWEQQTKTEQLPVKWNKMPSKLGLQNKEFATSLLPVSKQFIFWSWLSLLSPPAPPATSQVISKSLSWAS